MSKKLYAFGDSHITELTQAGRNIFGDTVGGRHWYVVLKPKDRYSPPECPMTTYGKMRMDRKICDLIRGNHLDNRSFVPGGIGQNVVIARINSVNVE